jgi:hypothetical protein
MPVQSATMVEELYVSIPGIEFLMYHALGIRWSAKRVQIIRCF